jgi:hypothetical protein
MRALCGAFLLAAALSQAQEQEPIQEPLQPPVQRLPAAADNSPESALAAVHGMVRNAATGEPLPRALVRIEGDADAGTLTDGEGRFELPGVPVGPQIFEVQKPEYYDPAAIGARSGGQMVSVTHNVLVAAEMPDLVFTLVPAGSIHGQLELSTGDPGGAFTVLLMRQVVQHGRAGWATTLRVIHTDDAGFYRFWGLPEGLYIVCTASELESRSATTDIEAGKGESVALNGYPPTCYPNVQEISTAGRIRLSAGEQAVANIQLTLEPYHTVTAAILDPNGRPLAEQSGVPSGQKALAPAAMILDSENHILFYTSRFDAATHSVQAALPDGSYTLAVAVRGDAPAAAGEPGPPQSHKHAEFLAGFAGFTVAGHSPTDLRIPLFSQHSFPLHLRAQTSGARQSGAFPASALSSSLRVSLSYAGEFSLGPDYELNALSDGPEDFDMIALPRFPYWVHTRVYGGDLCAGALSANGVNLVREPLVQGSLGSPAPLELTLRNDCARLNLALPAAASVLVPGIEPVYTVYVVPDFDSTEDVEPLPLRPSSGGSMTVPKLTPGSYRVYTFTTPIELEYRNSAAMAQLPVTGQAVTLAPGEAGSLVLEVPR